MSSDQARGVGAVKNRVFFYRGEPVHFAAAGSGRPVVFLHNGGACADVWAAQLADLAGERACYALDLPGFGRSGAASYRPYTLEEYVGMLRAFLDEIGARQAALVGNCVGSAIAYRFALQWPERVEKLVLFNVLTEDTLAGGFLGLLVRATAPATGLRKAVRWLCGPVRVPRPVARWIVGKQMRPATGPVAERLVGLYRQRAQVKALLDILVDLDSYERIDRARGCKGLPPAMLLWGARNEVLPLERGKQLAGRLGLQLEVLPGGHLVMLECPQAVNERLRRFLCS